MVLLISCYGNSWLDPGAAFVHGKFFWGGFLHLSVKVSRRYVNLESYPQTTAPGPQPWEASVVASLAVTKHEEAASGRSGKL